MGVEELDAGTTYQLRVVAKNGENLEAPSEWLEFRIGGVGELTTATRYKMFYCVHVL